MKKLALLAGVALLAACGSKQEAASPEAAASDTMPIDVSAGTAATPAAGATTANGSPVGSYDVTMPDGKTGTSTLLADGTYVDRDTNDKVTQKGTWSVKEGKTCFVPEGKPEECYTEGARNADGSFDAVGPDGKVTKVKPHAG